MAEQEDPEHTFFYRHTKITTIYRATIDKKGWRLAEKIFSYKSKEGTTMRWVAEAEV